MDRLVASFEENLPGGAEWRKGCPDRDYCILGASLEENNNVLKFIFCS